MFGVGNYGLLFQQRQTVKKCEPTKKFCYLQQLRMRAIIQTTKYVLIRYGMVEKYKDAANGIVTIAGC